MISDSVFSQRVIPIMLLVTLIGVGIYLMIKAWKNRRNTSNAVTIVIFILGGLVVFVSLYLLLFTVSFGVNSES